MQSRIIKFLGLKPNIHGTTLSHATNRMRQIAPCMIVIRRDFCLTRLVVRIRKASISTRLVLGNFKGRPPFPRRFLNLLWNFLAIWMIQQCARVVVMAYSWTTEKASETH